jgi:hypothetical protein
MIIKKLSQWVENHAQVLKIIRTSPPPSQCNDSIHFYRFANELAGHSKNRTYRTREESAEIWMDRL